MNWCLPCVERSKNQCTIQQRCEGPRRIPWPGADFSVSDRTGVQLGDGKWAPPTAPALLVGQMVSKSSGELTGMVTGYEDGHFHVAFTPGVPEEQWT